MIRVMVVDDHHLVRAGIQALLSKETDIEVVGQADDGIQAIARSRQLEPDVVVMDVGMPRFNGIEACAEIRRLSHPPEVVILSVHEDQVFVRTALMSGARAYLLKRSLKEELPLAIRSAMAGETYLSPSIAGALISEALIRQLDPNSSDSFAQLTPRERQVLKLIAEGETTKEIARALHLSPKTIENLRSRLRLKLGVSTLAELVRLAIKHGLVSQDMLPPA